ncbi:PilZ domain-containing protein [Methylomarinum vadi]|uniref:PilZ domain-containing protein n=1 Tax=Methylomarinum vadi TaxID=438855 RepID=UPI0004DF8AC0|nr:PilZ domain-containing protein [Methylomarinum vadi]
MAEERSYRKNLAIKGFVYMGGQELEVKVRNVSITGLLAELKTEGVMNDVKDVFQAIKLSPVIDIYLPELRVAGEAEMVRSEKVDGHLLFALEFRNIYYDVDNLVYSRRAYRKNMAAPGHVWINGESHTFTTENVSVDGLMIRLEGKLDLEPGAVLRYEFKRLELSGEAKVIWREQGEETTLLGLEYLYLEKDSIKGVPRFIHE